MVSLIIIRVVMSNAPGETISADFPFKSQYATIDGVRLHYIEEGSGPCLLFLHGNPTWSYIWRNIVPEVAPYARCVAVDLIGMGKSDKPDIEYRFFDHVRYLEAFITHLRLRNIVLVMHDWGSKLGFHYARRHESNVQAAAILGSMFMPVSSWGDIPDDFRDTLLGWRSLAGWDLVAERNVFFEEVLPSGIMRDLADEELRQYKSPYKRVASRKVLWRWAQEIPIEGQPADVGEAMAAVNEWLRKTKLPMLLFHATPGGLGQAPMVDWMTSNVTNLETMHVGKGIHFLQEDHPHRIGSHLAHWLRELGLSRSPEEG